MDRLFIVVPCYNEEEVFSYCVTNLRNVLISLKEKGKIAKDSRILFVNDGSRDKTWELITNEYNSSDDVWGIKLARNCGHQCALLAGLTVAREYSDISVSIDADLQDDIDAIEKMVDEYHNGCEIVYGVRNNRDSDTFFKRFTAETYYKIMSKMGVNTVYNHADFRLMSKRAMMELSKYNEVNVYLRGMVPLIGYKTANVEYSRKERTAGESKYPFKKMLGLAIDGITSFSVKPITMIVGLGVSVLTVCFIAAIYAFVSYFTGNASEGWTSLILSIWFLGGVQLVCIGIIGQYIGKIYKEVKKRPLFNIEELLDDNKEDK